MKILSRKFAQISMPTRKKYPYRGAFTEAARRLKKHRNSVARSYHRRNPKVVQMVDSIIEQQRLQTGRSHATE